MQEAELGLTNPAGSRFDSTGFPCINTIPASVPPQKLLQCVLEHEKAGTPLVITGVDRDSQWHSQYSSILGGGEPMDRKTGAVQNHPNLCSNGCLTFPPSQLILRKKAMNLLSSSGWKPSLLFRGICYLSARIKCFLR